MEDPQAQVQMDLLAEPSSQGLQGAPRAPPGKPAKELFWPLFWSYMEGEEAGSSLKGSVPGDEEDYPSEYSEEEEDYPPEYGEREAQESNDEEDDKEKAGFSGAAGGWEQGWPAPRNWDFKLLDSYGERSHLGAPGCCPLWSRVEMRVERELRASWTGPAGRPGAQGCRRCHQLNGDIAHGLQSFFPI